MKHVHTLARKVFYLKHKIRNRFYALSFNDVESQFNFENYLQLKALLNFFDDSVLNEGQFLNHLFENLEPGDVAFDIGANMGIHTVFMAKKVGSKGLVVAFEPDPESYKILTNNIQINKLENVEAFKIALGQSSGQGRLHKNDKIGFGSIHLFEYEGNESSIEVEIRNGDQIVREENLPIPKGVKLDVEGYELLVLKGLKSTLSHENCRFLSCEIHKDLFPIGTNPTDIINTIESNGFKMIDARNRGNEIHAVFKK